MKITSPEFDNCEYIPEEYTCDGMNMNPPLHLCDVPKKAKCLALIIDDPDAKSGCFVHWLMWNIPPKMEEIDSDNSIPLASVCGITSFGKPGYGGPCPPSGEEHRYFFKLYALNKELDLFCNARKEDLEKAMKGHVIEQAHLVGLYRRK